MTMMTLTSWSLAQQEKCYHLAPQGVKINLLHGITLINFQTPIPLSKANCRHCGSLIKYGSGTIAMHTHLDICKKKPDIMSKRQKLDSSSTTITLSSSSMIDQEACRIALVKLFVASELSFCTVKHESFQDFFSIVAPFLVVISHITLARDVLSLQSSEKVKLQSFFFSTLSKGLPHYRHMDFVTKFDLYVLDRVASE